MWLSRAVEFIYTNPPQPPPQPVMPHPSRHGDTTSSTPTRDRVSLQHHNPLEPPQTPIGRSPSQHAIHLHRVARAAGRTRNAKNPELNDADESNAPAIRLASRVNRFCAREAPGPVRHGMRMDATWNAKPRREIGDTMGGSGLGVFAEVVRRSCFCFGELFVVVVIVCFVMGRGLDFGFGGEVDGVGFG